MLLDADEGLVATPGAFTHREGCPSSRLAPRGVGQSINSGMSAHGSSFSRFAMVEVEVEHTARKQLCESGAKDSTVLLESAGWSWSGRSIFG